MSRDRYAITGGLPGLEAPYGRNESTFDLAILKYMTQKLLVTLRTGEQRSNESLPLRCSFEERRRRTHRMIIFTPPGIVSRGQPDVYRFCQQEAQSD